MLSRLWQKITGKNPEPETQSVVLSRDQHIVSRKKISPNALKVLYRLNSEGYQAFLVGGGVRDILLGLSPKDFDVATDATPEQISRIFKNCRLIGRRFRLAHILFGREVIEVATFRAAHDTDCQQSSKVSEKGMLMRDNVFGSLEDDAIRRDFTVNALYYSAQDFTVIDHVGGLKDLEMRQLRLIGDPVARYTEDPVRILRAIRLSAKLDLKIETETAKPIQKMAELISHVSSARLWDESSKLFLAGFAEKTWQLMIEQGVAQHIFTQTCRSLSHDKGDFAAFILQSLRSTDRRINQQLPVSPAFLFSVLLWQPLQHLSEKYLADGMPRQDAMQKAATQVLDRQRETIAIPKRFSIVMREIWNLQHRFFVLKPKSVETLIQHTRFRAAYDFLCLRSGNNAELTALADWWTKFQEANSSQRKQMLDAALTDDKRRSSSPNNKRKKRRKPSQTKLRSPRRSPNNQQG